MGRHAAEELTSSLCLSCGLCCDGAMYDHVPIVPSERLSPRVRASLAFVEGKQALPLPCVHHDGSRCTEYDGRPAACRGYACVLMGRLERGDVQLEEARAIVMKIKAVADDARGRLPAGAERAALLRAARAALTSNGELKGGADPELLLDLAALAVLIRRELDSGFAKNDDERAP
jgi:Fe-S-cluster containining protein